MTAGDALKRGSSGETSGPLELVAIDAASPAEAGAVVLLRDDRLAIRHGGCLDIVRPADIISVHAKKNLTCVVTRDATIRAYVPICDVIEILGRFGVVRIHRGVGVNIAHVRRMVGGGRHRLTVVLDTGVALTVGRVFQPAFRLQLGIPLPHRTGIGRRNGGRPNL
jgi:DNA-binding LytR/AlgR family response regulator